MGTLRKVTFFLEKNPGYGLFDFTEEEQNEINEKAKTRAGIFHEWGHEIVKTEDESYKNTYAIVEEQDTGKVFQVAPENIQFINQ